MEQTKQFRASAPTAEREMKSLTSGLTITLEFRNGSSFRELERFPACQNAQAHPKPFETASGNEARLFPAARDEALEMIETDANFVGPFNSFFNAIPI